MNKYSPELWLPRVKFLMPNVLGLTRKDSETFRIPSRALPVDQD